MVKRPKSPDVVEEARYFTVCQPFPLNATWIFEEDQQKCATWIAECIGLEHLLGMYHKPSARGMILLEISKAFTDHERLLGEHRWSEMLTKPDDEEKMRVSQVFHSFYTRGREAQKDGWGNVVIKSIWFKTWSPGKDRFKQPYPRTYWCPIPVEDKTNKQLCRPLPVDKVAPPPSPLVEPSVVGSAMWAQTKNAGKPTSEALTKAWNRDKSSTNKVDKPVQSNPDPGYSVPVPAGKPPGTTSRSAVEIATPEPNKSQASSRLVPLGKNKKKKAVPLNQFFAGEGDKKSNAAGWNKPAATPSASLPPAVVRLPVNGSSSTPRSANAWDKPIQLPVSPVPAATVKVENALEDISSWGNESATPTVDQEKIWSSPLPTKKKKKGKGGAAIPETPVSSTSPESTQLSSSQTGNISSPVRVVPPHYKFRPSAESEEDSDGEGIFAAMSGMTFTNIDDLPPEELEHAHVSAWERGAADAIKPETSETQAPTREYGNLWLSEEDPRAVKLPELICPTHNIACKKGICQDMTKLLRDKKRKELEAQWEKDGKKKKRGKKKKDARKDANSGSDDDDDDDNDRNENKTAEVDEDNFTIARPRGLRGRFGKPTKAQDKSEVQEPSNIGRMRAFPPDLPSASGRADDEVSGTPEPEPEGQFLTQW